MNPQLVEALPAAPAAHVFAPFEDLRPGMVVVLDAGEPEVVYRAYRNSYNGTAIIQTHLGQRNNPPPQIRVIPNSPGVAQLRVAAPEEIQRHMELPSWFNLGADPEVFVVDAHGEVIPAFAFLGEKQKLPDMDNTAHGNNTVAFYDGFQAEWTMKPSTCLGFITDFVREGLQKVRTAALAKFPDARLVVDSVLPIPYDMRQNVDPIHLQLGCAPSLNVYGESGMTVASPEDLDIRFAGSHMHFQLVSYYTNGIVVTPDIVTRVVRMLDAILGVALVSFGDGLHNRARRQFYGRAGEYRYHEDSHRLEYRVPDVSLIAHPATMNLLWELGRIVVKMGLIGLDFLWESNETDVRGIINEYDVPRARDLLHRNEPVLRAMLTKTGRAQEAEWNTGAEWTEIGTRALFHGVGTAVRDPRDLAGNWWLDHPTVAKKFVDHQFEDGGTPLDPAEWWKESYKRAHKHWPTGRIWSSAAKIIEAGGLV